MRCSRRAKRARLSAVDVFSRPEGTFGFEEFRRDPEDMGSWTPAAYYSRQEFGSVAAVRTAAERAVPWLAAVPEFRRDVGKAVKPDRFSRRRLKRVGEASVGSAAAEAPASCP